MGTLPDRSAAFPIIVTEKIQQKETESEGACQSSPPLLAVLGITMATNHVAGVWGGLQSHDENMFSSSESDEKEATTAKLWNDSNN